MRRAEGIHKAHEEQVLPSLHSEDVDLAQVNDMGNVLKLLTNWSQLGYHEHVERRPVVYLAYAE